MKNLTLYREVGPRLDSESDSSSRHIGPWFPGRIGNFDGKRGLSRFPIPAESAGIGDSLSVSPGARGQIGNLGEWDI
jgi:hypothetical protein